MSSIKATFSYNLQSVWQVVTSLTDYSWRSDVEKVEVISDTQFVATLRTLIAIPHGDSCRYIVNSGRVRPCRTLNEP